MSAVPSSGVMIMCKLAIVLMMLTMICNPTSSLSHFMTEQLSNDVSNEPVDIGGVVKKFILAIAPMIKKIEPICVPELSETYNFEDEAGTKLTATLSHSKLSHVNSYEINDSVINVTKSEVDAHIVHTFDRLKFFADYKSNGSAYNFNTTGNGSITFRIYNLTTNLDFQLTFEKGVQSKNLKIDYSFDHVKINATGLNVTGVDPKTVQELLSALVETYLKDKEPEISKELEVTIQSEFNREFESKSLVEVFTVLLDWLANRLISPKTC